MPLTPALSPLRRGEGDEFAKVLAEQGDDLADLHNLLGGGEDEGGETFPRVLPEQAESTAMSDGGTHGRVIGEGLENGGEIYLGLEEVPEKIPISYGRMGGGVKSISGLGEAQGVSSDDTMPGVVHALPAEGLAGIECGGEIVVADGEQDFSGGRHA